MAKHSRVIIDGGDELKWLDTLKQPIEHAGKERGGNGCRIHVFLVFKHICALKLEEMSVPLL